MSAKKKPVNKRQHLRFTPDPNEFARIDTNPNGDNFNFEYVALIVEEAPLGGCAFVGLDMIPLREGDLFRIQLGNLAPVHAEVVWRRQIDGQIYRFGVQFLE